METKTAIDGTVQSVSSQSERTTHFVVDFQKKNSLLTKCFFRVLNIKKLFQHFYFAESIEWRMFETVNKFSSIVQLHQMEKIGVKSNASRQSWVHINELNNWINCRGMKWTLLCLKLVDWCAWKKRNWYFFYDFFLNKNSHRWVQNVLSTWRNSCDILVIFIDNWIL